MTRIPASSVELPVGCGTSVRVSVIVPFRNAARYLRDLLTSIATQHLHESYEVVLVNNGSEDGAREIACEFVATRRWRLVDATRVANGSYARNAGASVAVGELLLFLDADDVITPGYFQAMVDALDGNEFVTSRVDCLALNAAWLHRAHEPWNSEELQVVYGFLPSSGGNVGVRREVFLRVGGYPEDFRACQDTVFAWRVQLAGTPLHFVERAVYQYRYRDSLRALYSQACNWGRGDAQLYRTFRSQGMPARSVRSSLRDWQHLLAIVASARERADFATVATRLGYVLGHLRGSLRFGVWYL